MSDELPDLVKFVFNASLMILVVSQFINLSFGPQAAGSFLLAPVEVLVAGVSTTLNAISSVISVFLPALSVFFALVFAIAIGRTVDRNLPNPHPVDTFGRFRRVVETETVVEECVNCGLEGVDGVERDARREVVLAGRVVRVESSTVVTECRACHEADVVTYGLRADAEDPAPPGAADDWGEDDQEDDDGEDLTRIMHVGDFLATNLRAKGFETIADVRAADREELTEVTGVGRQRAEDIQLSVRPVGMALGLDMAHRLDRAGFETATDIRAADRDELTDVRGVGEATARKIESAVADAEREVVA